MTGTDFGGACEDIYTSFCQSSIIDLKADDFSYRISAVICFQVSYCQLMIIWQQEKIYKIGKGKNLVSVNMINNMIMAWPKVL